MKIDAQVRSSKKNDKLTTLKKFQNQLWEIHLLYLLRLYCESSLVHDTEG